MIQESFYKRTGWSHTDILHPCSRCGRSRSVMYVEVMTPGRWEMFCEACGEPLYLMQELGKLAGADE